MTTARIMPKPFRPVTLGIVGGGQLARMLAQAAFRLGCDVFVLEKDRHSPAANLATRTILGDWDDPDSLIDLGRRVDVVTLENEFVASEALAVLEKSGHRLYPSAACVRMVQDKLTQKKAMETAGLPVPRFIEVSSPGDVAKALEEFGSPVVLKKRRNGYDGKGNATIEDASSIAEAWEKLGGGKNELYVEAFCPFERELAIMIVRGRDGGVATYPLVETVQRNHICHTVTAPAALPAKERAEAERIARAAVETIKGVGAFGVELFLGKDQRVLVNELAPRVHNSGHYTIEACRTSQFENHVRAVLGWPLGSPEMIVPGAVMINLLGAGLGDGTPLDLKNALAVDGAHVHVYGKAAARFERKMGHVTATGATREEAMERASRAAGAIAFGAKAVERSTGDEPLKARAAR